MRSDENFLDTSPAFDASGTVVLMESEGGQRRNNYKQGDVGPPGNDTEDGANRIATKI